MALRLLASLASITALTYLALCGWMFATQRQLLFMPQFTRADAADTRFAVIADGFTLRGWQINPGQPTALLYFGGNAEAVQMQRDDFARWFPQHTIYLLAYRGYGASDGAPSEAALKADALRLFDQIRPAHVAVDALGRSLGAGVALHLAARRPVNRLALITPYDSLAEVAAHHYPWLPVRWLMRDRFDARADAATLTQAPLLLIARRDQVIPPARTEALADQFPSRPQIVWLDADHNSVDLDPQFAAALQAHFASPTAPIPDARPQ